METHGIDEKELFEQELSAGDILSTELELVPQRIRQWQKNGKPGVVWFRVMAADDFIKFRKTLKADPQDDAWVRIFLLCACNSKGEPLFTREQLTALKQRSTAVFFELQDKLMQMHGMGHKSKTWPELKAILESVKVDPAVIALVESKWETAEDERKND